MADGKTHDRVGARVAIAWATFSAIAIAKPTTPLSMGEALEVADWFLVALMGGLLGFGWLSPDIDFSTVRSLPIQRWGILSFIWKPFQSKHRGITHVPVLGSLLMQGWLALIAAAIAAVCHAAGWQAPTMADLYEYRMQIGLISVSVVIQQLTHLYLDGL